MENNGRLVCICTGLYNYGDHLVLSIQKITKIQRCIKMGAPIFGLMDQVAANSGGLPVSAAMLQFFIISSVLSGIIPQISWSWDCGRRSCYSRLWLCLHGESFKLHVVTGQMLWRRCWMKIYLRRAGGAEVHARKAVLHIWYMMMRKYITCEKNSSPIFPLISRNLLWSPMMGQ